MITANELIPLVNYRICAVDIGNKGGIVINNHSVLGIWKMPASVQDRYMTISSWGPGIIVAENVHTMPMQGVVSNGTLMRNKGQIEGIAASLLQETEFIEPLKWIECFTSKRTKDFVLQEGRGKGMKDKKAWKNHLIEIAQPLVNYKLDEYTADAFLIWYWAARREAAMPMEKIPEYKLIFK